MFRTWWQAKWNTRTRRTRRARPVRDQWHRRRRPTLEAFEDRTLLSFLPAVNYPVGPPAAPFAVAAGDLRGNGILDLVTDNSNTQTVSVLLGNGDGTFQASVEYSLGLNSTRLLALGDVNGDGKLDIVVVGPDTSVLLGNGDGTFQAPIVTHFGGALGQIADFKLADANGDGKLDIVAVNSPGSQAVLSVALGNGDGTFGYPYAFSGVAFNPNSIAVGDFNGDGLPDAAIASSQTFCDPETGSCETTGSVDVFLGTGGGFFGAPTHINPVPGAGSIAIGDFNGDGVPDLLTVDSTVDNHDGISVMFGKGDGTFQKPVTSTRPQGALGPAVVADFNGDGILDMAAVSFPTNTVQVFLGNGDGTFPAPLSFAVDTGPTGLAVGDFNGDGLPDLATANYGTGRDVSVLINAADWSSATGGVARLPSADLIGNDMAAATPSVALRNTSPPMWVVAATEPLLAAPPSEAHDLGSSAWERGARNDEHAGWTADPFLPASLLDHAPSWALDEGGI